MSTLRWEHAELSFLDLDNSKLGLQSKLAGLRERAFQTVLRVTLEGSASPPVLQNTAGWLDAELAAFPIAQVADNSSVELSPAELQQLQQDHAILAQVLVDLGQLEHLLTGCPPPAANGAASPISLAEAQQIAANGKFELGSFSPSHFKLARQVLFQKLREVEA